MSDTVWKFLIAMDDRVDIDMPLGARILCVQMQGDALCLWARVNPKAPPETRHFRIAGTGHPLGDGMEAASYIGTFQLHGGALVFHVFECSPLRPVESEEK
jgi:hypothetical protein